MLTQNMSGNLMPPAGPPSMNAMNATAPVTTGHLQPVVLVISTMVGAVAMLLVQVPMVSKFISLPQEALLLVFVGFAVIFCGTS